MRIDREAGEVHFKIVYWGPGLAGRYTNIKFLFDRFHPAQKFENKLMRWNEEFGGLSLELPSTASGSEERFQKHHRPVEVQDSSSKAWPVNQASLDFGTMDGLKMKVVFVTTSSPLFYDPLRLKALQGADGIVFVADSQVERMMANIEWLDTLERYLRELGMDPEAVPMVLQYNKRDLKNALGTQQMQKLLNRGLRPWFEAVAPAGIGVLDTLRAVVELIRRRPEGR